MTSFRGEPASRLPTILRSPDPDIRALLAVLGLALLWQFQLSGVRTCLRQCGHR